MSGKQITAKRATLWKLILIVELIGCYMAVLAVISYSRGPERYGPAGKPLLVEADFSDINGLPAEQAKAPFTFENKDQGAAVGCLADVDLRDVHGIRVSFSVNCPTEYAGGILCTDLCNGEVGYDSLEQEYQLTLQAGQNEVEIILEPGQEHPDTAKLRFFTLDAAGYQLENVRIFEDIPQPKVPDELKIGVGMCFLLLAVTAFVGAVGRRNADKDGQ